SNHVRLTTAACNRLGLKTVLILRGEKPEHPTGNLLIDRILAPTEMHFIGSDGFPSKDDRDRAAQEVADAIAERLRSEGEIPYYIPNGCRALHGALGYAGCVLEIVQQLRQLQLAPSAVYSAVGTSSTYTGLLLGAQWFAQGEMRAVGISVAGTADGVISRVERQVEDVLRTLEQPAWPCRDAIEIDDRYLGDGYGLPTEAMRHAVLETAKREGILLDPVYTGKAMSGLIDRIRRGHHAVDDIIVLVHTGGIPALFAEGLAPVFSDDIGSPLRGLENDVRGG
ncbi:MAG TPA: pyridoxal-phosphate dependent enzyme, partial [Candidatus Acetothermia bacterium]|nr:pyridoxal-phosphate dependent enzyme [Candidatus Acetothermia bacterium]